MHSPPSSRRAEAGTGSRRGAGGARSTRRCGSFGAACWVCALVVARASATATPSENEAWHRLVLPARVGLAAIAFCAGWAVQEPDPSDERASTALIVVACAVTLVVARAAWRAIL